MKTKTRNDILQGPLALLVLKTLASNGRMHGYAITAHIKNVSANLLRVSCGLESIGLLTAIFEEALNVG